MKKTADILLIFTVVIPLVLLFWPFATWHGAPALVLRLIPAFAAQTLLCRVTKSRLLRALPLVATFAMAAWGTYLFFTSEHWINVTVWDLLADYASPFFGCAAALIVCAVTGKKGKY